MKLYVSRILVMAALLVKALTLVIPDYSIPYLITAAVMLVLAAAVLFLGSGISFASRVPWIGAVSLLIFYVLPFGPLSLDFLELIPQALGNLADRFLNREGPGLIAFGALIVLQLFFRRKANWVLVTVRYLAAWVFLSSLRDTVFYRSGVYYSNLISVIVCVCFVRELIAAIQGTTKPSMLSCVLLVLFSLLVYQLFSFLISDVLHHFFLMDSKNWLRTVLLVFACAVLALLEDYCRYAGQTSEIYRLHNAGWMMIFWCLLALIMHVWEDFSNIRILLLGYPVGCAVCSQLLAGFTKNMEDRWHTAFFGCMTAVVLVLMMLAKSFNLGLLLRWTLLAIVLLVLMSWKSIAGGKLRRGLAESGVGAAAILMLITMNMTDWSQFGDDPKRMLGAALAFVILSLICGNQHKLEQQASEIYRAEYKLAATVNRVLPLAVLAVASLKILFVL